LHPLTPAYREAVLRLTVAPEQQDFVAANADSLAEAEQNSDCVPFVVLAEGEPVGFAMYALDHDDGNFWIYRLMIDARFQRRGYGRMALEQLIERMAALPDCPRIMLGVEPANTTAAALYRSLGFVPTGAIIGGEIAMCKEMSARS